MLGVGAQTVLLCTHLLQLHRGEPELLHASYAEAARKALSVGFFLIIFSGAGAVLLHVGGENAAVLLAPAFLFKWLLILLALAAFWLHNRLSGWSNVVAGFAGGTWYGIFLVHSLAPVTDWFSLGALYIVWLTLFGLCWGIFVLIMRKAGAPAAAPVHTTAKPAPVVVAATPKPAPVVVVAPPPPPPPPPPPAPKPIPPPAPKPVFVAVPVPPPPPVVVQPAAPARPSVFKRFWFWLESLSAPRVSQAPTAPPAPITPKPLPPAPKPIPPPVPKPVAPAPLPKPAAPVAPHPLELASAPHPLSLPIPPKPAPAPVVTKPLAPVPPKPTVVPPAVPKKQTILQEVIDHMLVPALNVMPKRPEDIGKQNRAPVVKLSELDI